MLAITHRPSDSLAHGETTHIQRSRLDIALARQQHGDYCRALEQCGCRVEQTEGNAQFPDSVFVEDAAIVLGKLAVITPLGTESRRGESEKMVEVLRPFCRVERIDHPATIEGGDVLMVGDQLFVGLSSRTNVAGLQALEAIATPLGYRVSSIPVDHCLHLKTGVSRLPDDRLLVNPDWIPTPSFADHDLVEIDRREPFAANVVSIGKHLVCNAAHRYTIDKLDRAGYEIHPVDLAEFAKVEGGATCLSLLIPI